jgi:hypothetical protein
MTHQASLMITRTARTSKGLATLNLSPFPDSALWSRRSPAVLPHLANGALSAPGSHLPLYPIAFARTCSIRCFHPTSGARSLSQRGRGSQSPPGPFQIERRIALWGAGSQGMGDLQSIQNSSWFRAAGRMQVTASWMQFRDCFGKSISRPSTRIVGPPLVAGGEFSS